MKQNQLAYGVFSVLAAVAAVPASAKAPIASLEAAVRAITDRSDGTVGVGILHVESGESVYLNRGERFPMFSTYKLPIAMRVLQRVDEGTIGLDLQVTLGRTDLRPGASTAVTGRLRNGSARLTVRELVEAAVAASDNSASDALMTLAGGPPAVTAYLRALGILDVRVDRAEAQMAADLSGVTLPPEDEWTLERLNALFAVPIAQKQEAAARYLADPRDTATPEAMVALLRRVQRRDALQPPTAAFLVATMEKTRTGDGRIRGLLPPGTVVADKTGTGNVVAGLSIATNDVGLVTLPGDGGHVAVAVFIRGSRRSEAERERTIAQIARAAYDHWAGKP
jgi:beta-lactamase class A